MSNVVNMRRLALAGGKELREKAMQEGIEEEPYQQGKKD